MSMSILNHVRIRRPLHVPVLVTGAALLDIGTAHLLTNASVSFSWAVPAACALAIASFIWWRQAVLLVFMLVFVEGFFRDLLNTPYVLLAKDVVLVAIYARVFGGALLQHRQTFRPGDLNTPLAIFTVCAIVQVFNPHNSIMVGLVGLQTLLFNVPLLYVAYAMFRTRAEIQRFLLFLLVTAIPISALGILQFFQGPKAYAALGSSFAQSTFVTGAVLNGTQIYRPNSTFAWPSHFSTYLAYITLLLLAALLSRRRVLSVVAMVEAPLVLFTDMLSGQRALYVLLPLTMLIVIGAAGRRVPAKGWVILVASACLVAWLLTLLGSGSVGDRLASIALNNGQSVTGHILAGRGNFLVGITASPIGIGTGAAALGSRYVADSIPLFLESYYGEIAAELSVVGLAVFLWLSGSLLLALVRTVRGLDAGDDRALAGAVLAIAIFTAISNYFSNALDLAVASIFLWFLTGLALRLRDLLPDASIAPASATAAND